MRGYKVRAAMIAISVAWLAQPSAAPALSVPRPPAVKIPAPPSPRALELARRYLSETRRIDRTEAYYSAAYISFLKPTCASPQCRQDADDAVRQAVAKSVPGYLDQVALLWAQTFTEAELTQAIAFAESPVGRSMTAKSAALTGPEGVIGAQFSSKVANDAAAILCGKHPQDCPK